MIREKILKILIEKLFKFLFFLNIYLFIETEREREREREAETQAEGGAGSMPGARRRTQSRESSHPGIPSLVHSFERL